VHFTGGGGGPAAFSRQDRPALLAAGATIAGRGYLDLPLPFEEIVAPKFQIEMRWRLAHLLGYLRTWSATHRFVAAKACDPVDLVADDLARAWGDPNESRVATWPLTIRIGRS
jgi:hypothetical protein